MDMSKIDLVKLPDELLLKIFKKLNSTQLRYSMMGLNTRLDRILNDWTFTKDLTLFTYTSNDRICPLADNVLDRFCSQILPQIHHKISLLNLQSSSVERVLLATNYLHLHCLGLYNIDRETAERIFAGKLFNFNCFHDPRNIRYQNRSFTKLLR